MMYIVPFFIFTGALGGHFTVAVRGRLVGPGLQRPERPRPSDATCRRRLWFASWRPSWSLFWLEPSWSLFGWAFLVAFLARTFLAAFLVTFLTGAFLAAFLVAFLAVSWRPSWRFLGWSLLGGFLGHLFGGLFGWSLFGSLFGHLLLRPSWRLSWSPFWLEPSWRPWTLSWLDLLRWSSWWWIGGQGEISDGMGAS